MTFTQASRKLISLFSFNQVPRQPHSPSGFGIVDDRLLRCHWVPVQNADGSLHYEWVCETRN
jgi:hypothetical protein